jgi:hypothetical protein
LFSQAVLREYVAQSARREWPAACALVFFPVPCGPGSHGGGGLGGGIGGVLPAHLAALDPQCAPLSPPFPPHLLPRLLISRAHACPWARYNALFGGGDWAAAVAAAPRDAVAALLVTRRVTHYVTTAAAVAALDVAEALINFADGADAPQPQLFLPFVLVRMRSGGRGSG